MTNKKKSSEEVEETVKEKKLEEIMYTRDEFARSSNTLFNCKKELVLIALKDKEKCTILEARELVEKFKKGVVK